MENWQFVLKLAPESAHGHKKRSPATRREAHISWLSWVPSCGTGERVMRRNKCNHLLSKKEKVLSLSTSLLQNLKGCCFQYHLAVPCLQSTTEPSFRWQKKKLPAGITAQTAVATNNLIFPRGRLCMLFVVQSHLQETGYLQIKGD